MPRYFFDIHDGQILIDTEGSELDGFVEVRREAIRLAADTLFDESTKGEAPSDWHMDVLDEQRVLIMVLKFSLVMEKVLEADGA